MRTPWFIQIDAPDNDAPKPIGNGQSHTEIPSAPGYVTYDAGYPASVESPLYHIQTQGDTIGHTIGDNGLPEVNVDIRRSVDASMGGTPGVMNKQGYTSGISRSWRADRFGGQNVQFVRRDLSGDTGPVGVSNRGGLLKSAVESQYTIPPTMEEIYNSIVGGR